jgi:hypothetical protein
MHHILADVIAQFRAAQDRGVTILVGGLADTLGFAYPARIASG